MPYSGRKESIEAALDAPEISYGGDDRCAFSARPRHHALSLANGGGLRGHRLRWLHPDLLGSLGGGHVLGTADRARPRYPALQLDPAVLDTDDARGHRSDRAAPGARTLWHRTLQRDVLCDSCHAPHPAARRGARRLWRCRAALFGDRALLPAAADRLFCRGDRQRPPPRAPQTADVSPDGRPDDPGAGAHIPCINEASGRGGPTAALCSDPADPHGSGIDRCCDPLRTAPPRPRSSGIRLWWRDARNCALLWYGGLVRIDPRAREARWLNG